VQRLGGLLGHQVRVASKLGKGSVFAMRPRASLTYYGNPISDAHISDDRASAIASARTNSWGSLMNVKNAMLAVAFSGACLITSASALPIFSVPGVTTATQVRDDDAGDIAGRVIRGLGGSNRHRDSGYDGRRYRDRDYDGRRDRGRDYYGRRDRGYDRPRY
jgi:hypothetical protein